MNPDPSPTSPEPVSPHFTVLPPAIPGDSSLPPPPSSGGEGSGSDSGPGPRFSSLHPGLQALAKNPLVLAGGAVVAGVVLSRFMATPAARRFARELALEAFKQIKPAVAGAGGMAGSAAAGSVLSKGMEKYGPQIADYAKKMLADMLKKKE